MLKFPDQKIFPISFITFIFIISCSCWIGDEFYVSINTSSNGDTVSNNVVVRGYVTLSYGFFDSIVF